MEAERVAAAAPAEPDRTSEATSASGPVRLQQASADYICRLSRTYEDFYGREFNTSPHTAPPP